MKTTPELKMLLRSIKFLLKTVFFCIPINVAKKNQVIKVLGVFIFQTFSFGRIEARIINIIRIPPVNKIKKIRGNHTFPVFKCIKRNIIEVPIKISILIFIGFLALAIIKKVIAVINKTLFVIIFLSLN